MFELNIYKLAPITVNPNEQANMEFQNVTKLNVGLSQIAIKKLIVMIDKIMKLIYFFISIYLLMFKLICLYFILNYSIRITYLIKTNIDKYNLANYQKSLYIYNIK